MLRLSALADAEGQGFPQLRIGIVPGHAMTRGGDWYGRPVNLASRLTAIARGGSVLTTSDVSAACGRTSTGRRPARADPRRAGPGAPLSRAAAAARRGRHRRLELSAVQRRDRLGARRGRRAPQARTDGCASHASATTTPIALIASSVSCSPRAAATGPASAAPMGTGPSDTVKSYELTREIVCGGTWSWTEMSQSVKNSATPTPATSSSAAMPAVPRPLPRIAACVEATTSAPAATSIGRATVSRSTTALPSTVPTPKHATIAAQLEEPSSCCLASVGPSTNTAGSTNTW